MSIEPPEERLLPARLEEQLTLMQTRGWFTNAALIRELYTELLAAHEKTLGDLYDLQVRFDQLEIAYHQLKA